MRDTNGVEKWADIVPRVPGQVYFWLDHGNGAFPQAAAGSGSSNDYTFTFTPTYYENGVPNQNPWYESGTVDYNISSSVPSFNLSTLSSILITGGANSSIPISEIRNIRVQSYTQKFPIYQNLVGNNYSTMYIEIKNNVSYTTRFFNDTVYNFMVRADSTHSNGTLKFEYLMPEKNFWNHYYFTRSSDGSNVKLFINNIEIVPVNSYNHNTGSLSALGGNRSLNKLYIGATLNQGSEDGLMENYVNFAIITVII